VKRFKPGKPVVLSEAQLAELVKEGCELRAEMEARTRKMGMVTPEQLALRVR